MLRWERSSETYFYQTVNPPVVLRSRKEGRKGGRKEGKKGVRREGERKV